MRFNTLFIRFKPFLMPAAIGLLVSIPIWVLGVPGSVTGDLGHHMRVGNGFYEALTEGDIYPSWIAAANNGYGDPSCRYYPPGLYIFLSILQYLIGNWYYTFLVAITIINIFGSIGMYLWTRDLAKSHIAALISAAAYMLASFHVFELYIALQYAQYMATCVVPFLFYFIDRIFKQGGAKNVAGAGFFLTLIVCLHVPTTVYVAFSLTIYCLIRWWSIRDIRTVVNLGSVALLGLISSAGYLMTTLLEFQWKKPSGTEQGIWFDYKNNFLFYMPLSDEGGLMLRDLALMSLLLFTPNFILLIKKEKESWALFALTLFTFFMITPISLPVWDRFFILQETQFPYRWLSLTAVFTAAILSLTLKHIAEMWTSKLRPLALVIIGLILVPTSFSPSQIMKGADYLDPAGLQELFMAARSNRSNPDFLPIWTDGKLQAMSVPVESDREVKIIEWNQNTKVFEVGEGAQTTARIKLLYYPRWSTVADDNEILQTTPAADGALLVTLPPHAATVSIKFVEPLPIKIATVVSLLGFIAIAIMFVFGKPRPEPSQ